MDVPESSHGLSLPHSASRAGAIGYVRVHDGSGVVRASRSPLGPKAGQRDGDEPIDGGLGRQAVGCGEGVQAVAGQFVGADVVADVPDGGGLGDEVGDEVT
jgi:hypothetical protein